MSAVCVSVFWFRCFPDAWGKVIPMVILRSANIPGFWFISLTLRLGNYSISEAWSRKCFAHLDKLRQLTVPSAAYWVSPSLSSLRLLVWMFNYVPNLCFPVEADCFVFFLLFFLMCLVNWTALLDYNDSSHSLTVFISSPFPLKIERICIFVFLNIY